MELLQVYFQQLCIQKSGAAWLQASPLHQIKMLKNTDFIHTIISNILHDVAFSQKQPL